MAQATGLEPIPTVLETVMLPFTLSPYRINSATNCDTIYQKGDYIHENISSVFLHLV